MVAIREIREVKSGIVTVELPADFKAKQVEIIILPINDSANGTQDLRELLLAAPTLNHDGLKEYEKVREWMSQWNASDY